MLCLGLLTQFVYFKLDLPSHAVLLICWFFLILCSHHFLYERAMCSGEIALKITIIIIIIIICVYVSMYAFMDMDMDVCMYMCVYVCV